MLRDLKAPRSMRRVAAFVAAAFVLCSALPAGEKTAKTAKSSAAIERMTVDLKYLASDELEGRAVGTKGLDKAADYIRKQFAEAGLNVKAVDGDAFHYFEMSTGTNLGKTNALTFSNGNGETIELKIEDDFQPCSFGSAGKFQSEIVFLGYGIHAPNLEYSDYKGQDLKGKIAIIMRRRPQQGNPHSVFGTTDAQTYQSLRHKYTEAFNRGAAAVLFVNDPHSTRQESQRRDRLVARSKDAVLKAAEELEAAESAERKDEKTIANVRKRLYSAVRKLKNARKRTSGDVDELMKFGYGGNAYRGKDPRPMYHVSQDACNRLLKASLNKTLADLEAEIDAKLEPVTSTLPSWKAAGEVSLTPVVEKVKNVVAVLEGDGPLADETVVVGAHYDHVGYGKYGSRSPGPIHNGADDNASGTVVLLELARRLAAREEKLPRRVVFIAFTAEELGLIGSKKYVEKPTFPLDKTIAMINMDMVGRLRDGKLTVFAVGSSPAWKPLLEKHGGDRFKLTLNNFLFPRSDHASFVQKKVPAIHVFTNTHPDYHRPSDKWDKVNFEGMAEVADLVEKLVVETAGLKERPSYAEVPANAPGKKIVAGRWPYFGSIPDYAAQVEGIRITGVGKGSPAEKAGLKEGDVIVKVGRFKVGDIEDYTYALSQFKAGDTAEVHVKRNGKVVELKTTFAKQK